MTTFMRSSHTRTTLRRLREYTVLFQSYQSYRQQNRLPPLAQRESFQRCQSCLPVGLLRYVYWLLTHDHRNPLTTLDQKGRCVACRQAAHPEWRTSISLGEVIFVCVCGRVFIPHFLLNQK